MGEKDGKKKWEIRGERVEKGEREREREEAGWGDIYGEREAER